VAEDQQALRLISDMLVHLADGMYSWCMLLTFAFDCQPSAAELISALLAHPRYQDGCWSKWTGPEGIHGPYRLEALSVNGFEPCSAAAAVHILNDWPASNLNPWVSDEMLLSQEIVAAWVSPLLIVANEIHRLAVPREGNEHDAGWVVGFGGFHEFIAIDRDRAELTLIIGTDD
jgi:hypothetical protein